MLLRRHLPQGFLLPEVGNAVGPKGNDGDGHSVVLPSWMQDRAASRAPGCLLFHDYTVMAKRRPLSCLTHPGVWLIIPHYVIENLGG